MYALVYVSKSHLFSTSTMTHNMVVDLHRETLECLAQCALRFHIMEKKINCCMNVFFVVVTMIHDREKTPLRRDIELDPKKCEFP